MSKNTLTSELGGRVEIADFENGIAAAEFAFGVTERTQRILDLQPSS